MSKSGFSFAATGAAILSGLLLWLSWPDHGFTPLIFIAFVPLLFAENALSTSKKKRIGLRVFGLFYLSMLIWNGLTTWWIYFASDVGSYVAIGLNSLFMALVWQTFYQVKKKNGNAIGYTVLVLFWVAFEHLHLNWEISWPWLTIGNVFSTHPAWVQWYEFTGTLGGSIWVLAINLFMFQLLKNLWYRDLLLKLRKINILILSFVIFILVTGPLILSLYLYHNYRDKGTPVEVAIVQPNIDPYNEKFNGTGPEQLAKILRISATVIDSSTQYLFAPETALPDGIWEDRLESDASIRTIRKFLEGFPHLNFITGLTSFQEYPDSTNISLTARKFKDGSTYFDVYNSAMLIANAMPVQMYHKSRLVPGVEKMPYPQFFKFLEKYAIDKGGTSGSLGTQPFRTNFVALDGTRIAPAICYESVYGGFMSGYMRDTAEFMGIITNDGWWGDTPGYRQHMNYARLRAIEFRKSIARSANTGISCFINQRGDIISQTGWWTDDAIKTTLYKNNIITFYARHGDYLGFICSFLTVTLLLYFGIKRMIGLF